MTPAPRRALLFLRSQGQAAWVPGSPRLRETAAGLELPVQQAWAEAAHQRRRGVVVVHGPGDGGSTALARLAAAAGEPTRRLAPGPRVAAEIDEAALAGITVLVDGLDAEAAAAIRRTLDQHPSARIAATCRRAAYRGDVLVGPGLLELHLAPLDPAEEAAVARAHADPDTAAAVVAALRAPDRRSPAATALRRCPFTLARLCALARAGRRPAELPRDLAELLAASGSDDAGRLEAMAADADAWRFDVGDTPAPRFLDIPAGRFHMGSPEDEEGRWSDEGPVHPVSVPAFRLGALPVTNAEYARFVDAHPDLEPPPWWGDPRFNQPAQPVTGIGRAAARRFAAWAGGRLPSEAEWERACRAGTAGARYGPLDEVAWYDGNSDGRLHPAGTRAANDLGVHDTLGNAWEWVADDHHPSHEAAPTDGGARLGDPPGERGVLRGGSWADAPHVVRAATRLAHHPGPRLGNVGLRLARDAP